MTATVEELAESSSDFPHVEKLSGEAAEKLSLLCEQLDKSGVGTAARRLSNIDAIVGTMSFPVIERLAAPERVLAELDEVQSQPVRRLQSLRNQAALLPIFLTWLSVGLAVLVGDTSALLPVYGVVAVVDAGLIGWVVLLTRQVHDKEQQAATKYDEIAEHVDTAVRSLAVAMQSHALQDPANPEEWAVAARDVLADARRQTAELFEATMTSVDKANENLKSVCTETEALVGLLAEQTRKTLESLQQANEQMVTRVAKEAVAVLNSAVSEDRALVGQQLAPLIDKFRANVESFARSYDTYQENTAAFVAVTSDVGVATKILGESAKSYTDIAGSIDTHLQNIDGSQQHFIQQVTESARTMGTAATAMESVSTLLSDRLRSDLEVITQQLSSSSAQLAAVDTNLTASTEALGGAAAELQRAAEALGKVTPRRRRRPIFRRR